MDFTHQTFFLDCPENHRGDPYEFQKEIVKTIKVYDTEEYLVAYEAENSKGEEKPHYHIIVYTSYKNCTNIIQHFVRKYELSNKSGKVGGLRKYGRLKQPIENLEKLKQYCCKEGNVLSSYSNEVIDDLYRKSFNKRQNIKEKICRTLDEKFKTRYNTDSGEIKEQIIQILIDFKIHIRKSLVDSYYIWYSQASELEHMTLNAHHIYRYLYHLNDLKL